MLYASSAAFAPHDLADVIRNVHVILRHITADVTAADVIASAPATRTGDGRTNCHSCWPVSRRWGHQLLAAGGGSGGRVST